MFLTDWCFQFFGNSLSFSDTVTHLGHILHCKLEDGVDVTAAMCRQANYLLHTFAGCDMIVKTKLVVTHCLSLYGCVLWRLDCRKIRSLETAFNNILRKIWKLPRQCHTHCVAGVDSLFNRIPDLFTKFVTRSLSSNYTLIRSVFSWASTHAYSAVGKPELFDEEPSEVYSTDDIVCAGFVPDIRLGRIVFDSPEATNMIIDSICCD